MSVHVKPQWMAIAQSVALMSKDDTKVGALLIGPEGEGLAWGYNGPCRGDDDNDPEVWGAKKDFRVEHAERNVIAAAARRGVATLGCTIVVTRFPCAACVRMLQQAGIWRVVSPPPNLHGRWAPHQVEARQMMARFGMQHVEI